MNSLELKGLRIARGKTQSYMGERIEKSLDSYAKKERGEVLFTPEEMAIVASELEMTFEQFNAIFFTNILPFSNIGNSLSPTGNSIAEKRVD